MATFSSSYPQSTFLYSPCSSAAIAAMMKAKVVREMEELEDCQRRAELLRLMECTSAQSQFIIGSAAGVLTGYFGSKGGGKGCAVVAGVGLVAIRTVMHLMTRTTPFIMCGIEPQSLDLMERIVDESKTIFRRNIYVVTGFLLGYIAYRIS